MKKTTPSLDTRPRFGFCHDLDREPQLIRERAGEGDRAYGRSRRMAVAVIPMPYLSPKMKRLVREFTADLWPKENSRG